MKNKMNRFATLSSLCLILLLSVSLLQAQNGNERYNLAVYAMGLQEGKPIETSIKVIAQNTAITHLTGKGNYRLIERSTEFLKAIDKEMATQLSGDVADNQIAVLGEDFGAQKVCVVSIVIDDGYMYVASRIVDVSTKTSFESGQADESNYSRVSQVRPTVEKAISQLLGTPNTTTSATRPSVPGTDKHFTVNGVTFKMVFVKGGGLYLGCTSGSGSCDSDEIPSHYVTLSDYYVGETEVTQALWKAVMGYNNNPSNWQGDRLPVEMVSWTDCNEFVSRVNSLLAEQLPQGYRFALPSEAQWEYAARGGQKSSGSLYAGSNNVNFVAWYTVNSGSRTHEVKLKAPNELGLYDMSGNVWEWCEDWYSSSWYSDNVNWTDPVNAFAGSNRVLRGGSWYNNVSGCRVSNRNGTAPSYRGDDCGFRLALVRQW